MMPVLITERLTLRPWRPDDLPDLARLNGDREVMAYFPAPLSVEESAWMLDQLMEKTAGDGFGFAAVERRDTGEFLGFAGLNRPRYKAPLPFEPCVEIGWRLVRGAWGQGIASEAARTWLRFGFETLRLAEIVSFTAVVNERSRAVMERIGMTRDAEGDFDHPALAEGHRLRRHVLYRLQRDDFTRRSAP